MRPIADIIWCGVSAPVLQGVFVGLGISAVGLIAFPFGFALVRPVSGKQSDYGRAAAYVQWARRIAWTLGVFASITLVGYIILYSDSRGKFCAERFDHNMQVAVFIWTAIAGVTFGLLALTAVLRGLTRRLGR
jgi:hypothetical protein